MNAAFIFLWMIFFHVVADYNLQGWLASAKQKSYWEANAPDELYKHDYICALIMHSISWTFMIMLPIAYAQGFAIDGMFVTIFIANVILHAQIDNMKANQKLINLWHDQIMHFIQMILTFVVCYVI
jgi:hypothetical protein